MEEIALVSVCGVDLTLYSLLALAACVLAACALALLWKQRGHKAGEAVLYAFLSALCGLILGRIVFCAVRFDAMFYDAMGDFMGLAPFFFLDTGSVNVVGVVLGCLLGAYLTGNLTAANPAELLDAAALPGLILFAALRFVEPLSGQGYGPLLEEPALRWAPLALDSGWGDWSLSVCFVEGVLALLAAGLTALLRHQRTGTRAMQAIALLAAGQIIPEILRQDNVLLIFIFAPVTQIGFAVLLFGAQLFALVRGLRQGLPGRMAAREIALLLLGVVLLIGAEFALDKTEWSRGLLYGGMIVVLGLMAWLVLQRIGKEDRK